MSETRFDDSVAIVESGLTDIDGKLGGYEVNVSFAVNKNCSS